MESINGNEIEDDLDMLTNDFINDEEESPDLEDIRSQKERAAGNGCLH